MRITFSNGSFLEPNAETESHNDKFVSEGRYYYLEADGSLLIIEGNEARRLTEWNENDIR